MTGQRNIVDDIKELNVEVCRYLWRMSAVGESPSVLSPHLIYPEYTSHNRRVSEQEARFAYAEVLTSSPYYYSVETPTEERYMFTGNTEISARSDMSLYLLLENGLTKVANVELKAGNPRPTHIAKDVEKLVREGTRGGPVHGNWFHVLPAADHATVTVLLNKFHRAFDAVEQRPNWQDAGQLSIVICCCVLGRRPQTGWAGIRHFECA